jgi:hypothetical protein
MRKFYLLTVLIALFIGANVFAQSARADTRQTQDTLITPAGKAAVNDQGPFRGLGRKTPIRKKPHGIGRDPLGEVVIEGGGGGGGGGGCTSYTWYKDADGDGYSDGSSVFQCNQPAYYKLPGQLIATSGDCNDYDASVHPNAPEIPNDGIDQNCNGYDLKAWYYDHDGDGYGSSFVIFSEFPIAGFVLNNSDCNDFDANIHPGATEIPDDGIDQDCDGYDLKTWYWDLDGDGYGGVYYGGYFQTVLSNFQPSPYLVSNNSDCNDFDPRVHPGATEIPDDGVDQDCDGYDLKTWYQDSDGDGYGNISVTQLANTQPQGYVADHTDCNDNDAAVHPAAAGDANCDGSLKTWYQDQDEDGYGNPSVYVTAVNAPAHYVTDNTDCDDAKDSIHPGAQEIPDDGIDQDCDGYDLKTWYEDHDGDGYGNPLVHQTANTRPTGYVSDHSDCDDSKAFINPGATDIPGNGIDENCDGYDLKTWYRDFDGDGYGDASVHVTANTQPPGFVLDHTDCDDTKASIHPGAQEIPDDGIDQDCDGYDLKTWYQDQDGDSYGNASVHVTANTQPDGYVSDHTDCDDTNSAFNPGIQEIADDGIDQDCDGYDLKTWYKDFDGDGYGDPAIHQMANIQPAGYVDNDKDCNDHDASIHPKAIDIPDDGIDQNCDGSDLKTWYQDSDGDGFGNLAVHQTANTQPEGYVSNHTDCNDGDASIHPGATEIPDDGIDQDCDGYDLITWYQDFDGDGYGNPAVPQTSNTQLPGYVDNNKDCNDHNASIHPKATEIPDDGIDQNCDGSDLRTWYQDSDGDGFGNAAVHQTANTQPAGYVLNHTDCNDGDANTHPGATDIPDNGKDENCDGYDLRTWYQDHDGDGYGNVAVDQTANTQPAGYVLDHTDCDDNNASIHPGASLGITAPTAKIVNTDPGTCSASNVALGVASYANNCTLLTVTNDAPATFPKGVTTVHWKVTDGNGVTATASQTVTVVDNEKPKITCPTIPVQCYSPSGTYTIAPLTASDNCAILSTTFVISGATSRSGNGNNASGAFNLGNSAIKWTVTDGSGNSSTCSAIVSVDKVDATIPDVYASGITSSIGSPNTIYIGYGGSSVTLTAQVSSNLSPNSYSYKWTTGSPGGAGFATTQTITVSPSTTTTYFVSIKDVNNCAQTVQVSKQINVVDIRCGSGKINVCQFKNGSYSTSCVSSTTKTISGLPAGSYLGACVKTVTAKKVIPEESGLAITANPNPSNESFTVKVSPAANDGTITMRVFNISGQLVEMKKINAMQTFRIGENYKRGIYLIEVTSGPERKTLTLIKQ